MASSQIFAFFFVTLVLPTITGATEHVVGGDRGWATDVDYKAWAEGRQFFVGDTLVFNYFRGDHNVIKVNEAGFQMCMASSGDEKLVSGNDVVSLLTPGKKWYICGIPGHCDVTGQKLAITVLPQSLSPSPPPSVVEQTGSAPAMIVSTSWVLVVAVIAILVL